MFIPRLCSTVVLLALFGASIFLNNLIGHSVFILLALFLSFFVTKELCAMLRNIGMETFLYPLCIFNTALAGCIFLFYNSKYQLLAFCLMLAILPILALLFLLGVKNSEMKLKKLFHTFAAFFLFIIPIFFIINIYIYGRQLVVSEEKYSFNVLFLFFILATKIGDIGAYVTGTLSNKLLPGGNHKMIPSISPGKSYEGAAGGLFFTILLCLFFHWKTGFVVSVTSAIVTGILFFFGGMAGDLAESALKRACKVKDSGHTIPGIGGIYDLVDSPMMTAPIFYILLILEQNFNLEFFRI